MAGKRDDFPEVPDTELTPRERQELRKILIAQQRTMWLWATLRVWATWIAIVVGGIYAGLTIIRDGLKSLLGIGGGPP